MLRVRQPPVGGDERRSVRVAPCDERAGPLLLLSTSGRSPRVIVSLSTTPPKASELLVVSMPLPVPPPPPVLAVEQPSMTANRRAMARRINGVLDGIMVGIVPTKCPRSQGNVDTWCND